jgi:hypothetical protein
LTFQISSMGLHGPIFIRKLDVAAIVSPNKPNNQPECITPDSPIHRTPLLLVHLLEPLFHCTKFRFPHSQLVQLTAFTVISSFCLTSILLRAISSALYWFVKYCLIYNCLLVRASLKSLSSLIMISAETSLIIVLYRRPCIAFSLS